MPNIMLVGKMPKSLRYESFREVMRSLGYDDKDAVITTMRRDPLYYHSAIIMYGFDGTEKDEQNRNILLDIMRKTGMPADFVESECRTVGAKEEKAPHLVVITGYDHVKKVIADLKSMRWGYDVEMHLTDTNLFHKAQQKFYVRIKLLEEEAEQFYPIIKELARIGIKRERIWCNIIYDFIPRDKLK